jgi:hypothetical protein
MFTQHQRGARKTRMPKGLRATAEHQEPLGWGVGIAATHVVGGW